MPGEQAQGTGAGQASGKVTIKHGVHTHEVKPGMSIGQLRKEYGPLFRIPDEAKGYSGTNQLSDDTIAEAGMVIEFVRKSGEKGCK